MWLWIIFNYAYHCDIPYLKDKQLYDIYQDKSDNDINMTNTFCRMARPISQRTCICKYFWYGEYIPVYVHATECVITFSKHIIRPRALLKRTWFCQSRLYISRNISKRSRRINTPITPGNWIRICPSFESIPNTLYIWVWDTTEK